MPRQGQKINLILSMPSISYSANERAAEATELSQKLALPINNTDDVQLCALEDKWALKLNGMQPIWVDFNISHWRKGKYSCKNEALVKACKAKEGVNILDLTAGFGRDAAILLGTGASVSLVERDKIMQILLQDGLARADLKLKAKIRLINSEAKEVLTKLNKANLPEVIYLDPMHPIRKKSAQVKKVMFALQTFIKPDDNYTDLLTLARRCARERVVVKCPVTQPPVCIPNHSIGGKTIRFDVYLADGGNGNADGNVIGIKLR